MTFDRLILMCDGHIIYQGAADKSAEYFRNSLGFKIGSHCNPADFYMNVLSVNYPKGELDEKKVTFLKNKYDKLIDPNIPLEDKLVCLPPPDLSHSIVSGKVSFLKELK